MEQANCITDYLKILEPYKVCHSCFYRGQLELHFILLLKM